MIGFCADEVGRIIGSEPLSWKCRCYEIACAMLDHGIVEGEPRYGHWLGPIHEESVFAHRATHGFCQHGWIECENGLICDPTRWVFEQPDRHPRPYIFYAEDTHDYYDPGGNVLRERNSGPPPAVAKHQRTIKFPITMLGVARMGKPPYAKEQLFWLANLSLRQLGGEATKIYKAIIAAGLPGFIPYDNRILVLGKTWNANT